MCVVLSVSVSEFSPSSGLSCFPWSLVRSCLPSLSACFLFPGSYSLSLSVSSVLISFLFLLFLGFLSLYLPILCRGFISPLGRGREGPGAQARGSQRRESPLTRWALPGGQFGPETVQSSLHAHRVFCSRTLSPLGPSALAERHGPRPIWGSPSRNPGRALSACVFAELGLQGKAFLCSCSFSFPRADDNRRRWIGTGSGGDVKI